MCVWFCYSFTICFLRSWFPETVFIIHSYGIIILILIYRYYWLSFLGFSMLKFKLLRNSSFFIQLTFLIILIGQHNYVLSLYIVLILWIYWCCMDNLFYLFNIISKFGICLLTAESPWSRVRLNRSNSGTTLEFARLKLGK